MTSPIPPGWYPAEGDPPGTQRYWDGARWQGGPQAVPSPALGFAPPPAIRYPESSNALAALLVSIGGFVFCGLLWPIGWWLGSREVRGIDEGRRDPTNRGMARAGQLIGMIFTILMIIVIVGAVALIVVGNAAQ